MTTWRLTTIVSCAAAGAERGAQDAAIELGLEHGGWRADGDDIPDIYAGRMRATRDRGFARRLNVQDSDGTLIVTRVGELTRVGAFVDRVVQDQRKASLQVCLPALGGSQVPESLANDVRNWIREDRISVLHVSGPSEEDEPGIELATRDLLVWIIEDEVDSAQRSAR